MFRESVGVNWRNDFAAWHVVWLAEWHATCRTWAWLRGVAPSRSQWTRTVTKILLAFCILLPCRLIAQASYPGYMHALCFHAASSGKMWLIFKLFLQFSIIMYSYTRTQRLFTAIYFLVFYLDCWTLKNNGARAFTRTLLFALISLVSLLVFFCFTLTLGRTSKLIPPPWYKGRGGGRNPSLGFSF